MDHKESSSLTTATTKDTTDNVSNDTIMDGANSATTGTVVENDEQVVEENEAKRTKLEPEIRKRGQRLFGVLMGTLNKFKSETTQKSDAVSTLYLSKIYFDPRKITHTIHRL